jgi:hypothetical protein
VIGASLLLTNEKLLFLWDATRGAKEIADINTKAVMFVDPCVLRRDAMTLAAEVDAIT